MSRKVLYNIVIITLIWIVVISVGVYITMMKQPEELERAEKAEKVERLKQTELASLASEHATSLARADDAVQKWRARYKVIPRELTGPEVVGYLNELTQSGFENFDVKYQGVSNTPDYSTHTFNAEGRGYFTDLYRIIWELENNRYFYRVSNLNLDHIDLITEDKETGRDRMKVMVSFRFVITSYFGGTEGMSAPLEEDPTVDENTLTISRAKSDLPPVPKAVLPNERPDVNPFFPLIMDNIPPNTHGLIDLEEAELVSIVGEQAFFKEAGELRPVGVGGNVYLGQITQIDPIEGVVNARLNKGGIIDQVEIYLQSGEVSQSSVGAVRRAPR